MLNWIFKKKQGEQNGLPAVDTGDSKKDIIAATRCVYASPEVMCRNGSALPSQEQYPFNHSEPCGKNDGALKTVGAEPAQTIENTSRGKEWDPDTTLKECRYCGQLLPIWANYCLNCGKKLI